MRAQRPAWSLRRRLRTGLVVSGVAIGLALTFAVVALGQVARYQDETADAVFLTALDLETLQADLVDADAAVRAFALSGEEEMLAAYAGFDIGRVAELRQRAGTQLERAPEVTATFDELGEAVARWVEHGADPVVAQTRQDGPGIGVAPSLQADGDLFAEVRETAASARAELLHHRETTATQLSSWRRAFAGAMGVIAITAVAVGTGLWLYLRRWVTGPLDRLAADSRAVTEGELDREVRGTGPNEVVALAADVDQMRRMLVTQLAEVEAARVELEASNRDLEQFAYVASHDMQEPLRKVASFTQLLERRYSDQLDDRARQYIGFAADGAKRMQRLIQDLLAFSRLGRGGQQPEPVDLGDALAEALDNLAETITENGAQVSVTTELPTVVGHRVPLTQLLQNLVGNAVKFQAPDRAPQISLGAERVGTEWLLWCADNGIGIEPRHAERVFAIFQRLHPKNDYPGTGIGLAMCQRIVELHGGRIWVEPQPQTPGTTVRWTLPVPGESRVVGTLAPDVVGHNGAQPSTETQGSP